MPPTLAQPETTPLDAVTIAVLRRATLDALPHAPHTSEAGKTERGEAACSAIAALRPRDPLEAMIAANCITAEYHMLDTYRIAAMPDLPPALRMRCVGRAIALNRLVTGAMHELHKRRADALPRRTMQAAPAAEAAPAPMPEMARPAPPPQPVSAAAKQQGAAVSRKAARVFDRWRANAPPPGPVPRAALSPTEAFHARILEEIAARCEASVVALAA